ncbi:MAG: hypothetical protein QOE59_1633 [Actinomycetota bacterium]|nr:hypothetical protein [Actinomycetota bacterium]
MESLERRDSVTSRNLGRARQTLNRSLRDLAERDLAERGPVEPRPVGRAVVADTVGPATFAREQADGPRSG